MKRIIIFSFISLFALSCSEYDDDGLPTEPGDVVITNPDGTKKIKAVNSTVTGSMDQGIGPMDIEITSETIFATDSYSSETTNTTQFLGVEGTSTSISHTSEILDGFNITKIDMREQSDPNSRYIYNFSYTGDELNGYSVTRGGAVYGNGTVTSSENQITLETTSQNSLFTPSTCVFTLANGYISNAEITNTNDNTVYNIEFSRSNTNITQLVLNGPSGSKTYNYTYDANINPFHQVYANPVHKANAEIVRFIAAQFQENISGLNTDLNNLETSFRYILSEGSNNLLTASSNNETLETRNYSYDTDNYPISFSAEGSSQISMGGLLDEMIAQLVTMMEGIGATQEEIDEAIAALQDDMGDILIQVSGTGEIQYYE